MMSLWKQRSPRVEKILDGVPFPVIENGRSFRDRMQRERVDESDILAAARDKQGLERLDQIKHAVVEASGGISIVPKERRRPDCMGTHTMIGGSSASFSRCELPSFAERPRRTCADRR